MYYKSSEEIKDECFKELKSLLGMMFCEFDSNEIMELVESMRLCYGSDN